jgi:hypothetical protein
MYDGHFSSLTGPSSHSSGGSSPSSIFSTHDEMRRIKKAIRAHQHKDVSEAIEKELYAYYTAGIPGYDDPAVKIPGHEILPDDIQGRKEAWITRGVYDVKADTQPKLRGMLPSHNQWIGEMKTFENYTFHVTGWMMQVGMGYMLLPAFS